jgi:hypothetical protein
LRGAYGAVFPEEMQKQQQDGPANQAHVKILIDTHSGDAGKADEPEPSEEFVA